MHLVCQGSGQAVLFLHGLPTSHRLWSGVVEKMTGQFKCMAVDLPGLGRTPPSQQGFRRLDVIACALDAIRVEHNIESWHIVGHDAGCAIAIHYAHAFPERVGRLALLSPSIFPDLKPFFLFEPLRTQIFGEMVAPLINLFFWNFVMRSALARSGGAKDAVNDFRAPFRGLRGAWRLMSLLRWGHPAKVLSAIPSYLPEILARTLIIHGAEDPAVPKAFAARAGEAIPNSKVVLLDSGHFLPLTDAGEVAAELLGFFAAAQTVQLQRAETL